ncbi:MAG: DUF6288 domain-containing protein [Planctomycetota bacterium]
MALPCRPPAAIVAGAAIALAPLAPAQAENRHREQAVGRAVAWLQKTIDPATWLTETSGNARGKRIVARSMLAWLHASGAAPAQEAGTEALDAAQRRVVAGRSLEDMSFATWLLGSASFYLAECTLRDESVHPSWDRLVARLGELRNSEGGWAHGNMEGLVPGYPSTVMAATNWALSSLGLARALGAEVPAEFIDGGVALLEATQSSTGAFPYGGRPYRIGMEAGRTGGAVIALAAVDRADTDAFRRATMYLYRNMARVPEGHASPAMHVMNGALAAYALGDAAWQRYEQEVVARLLAAQRDDGTFEDLLGERSPDSMRLMGDAVSSHAYVTSLYAAALHVPKTRLAHWLRRRVRFTPPTDTIADRAPQPLWSRAADGVVGLTTSAAVGSAGAVVAIFENGDIITLAAADGREVSHAATGLQLEPALRVRRRADDLLAWTKGGGPMFVFDLAAQNLRWRAAVSMAPFAGVRLGARDVYFVDINGTATARRLIDGVASRSLKLPGGLKRQVVPLDDGAVIAVADSRIQCIESDGEVRWRGRNRHPKAAVAGTWTGIVAIDDRCFFGSTDGTVTCRGLDDAELVWRATLDAGVVQVVAAGNTGMVLALTAAGTVAALNGETPAWATNVSDGCQDPDEHPTRIVASDDAVWVQATGAQRLLSLSLEDGSINTRLPCSATAAVAIGVDLAYVANGEAVVAFSLK